MHGKQKFYTLIVAFQFVLVACVYFSVSFITEVLVLIHQMPHWPEPLGMPSCSSL